HRAHTGISFLCLCARAVSPSGTRCPAREGSGPAAVNCSPTTGHAHDGVNTLARLHILGAGTPQPTAELWGSAYAIEFDEHVVMVDCGPAATHKLLRSGLWVTDVEWLFFTHHHSDHNVDFPCLMLFRWDQTTDEPPLQVIGPPPTEALTEKLFGEKGAFADDIRARIEDIASKRCHTQRGGTLPRPGPSYTARDVEPGTVVEGAGWTATCARSQHMQPLLWPLAWRFDSEDGSVCFTGDTAPCEEVARLADGVHTIVANAPLSREALHEDLATCIYSAGDAAELAREAGAERLVLVHLANAMVRDREATVGELSVDFGGEIIIPDEGASIAL
ncbi:MAG: MBL fold metallo-hydrolase, partial [Armatimonadia bacterium]|nr:MBL fold metallo-hydrolase [Armatimonadia bacterium]